jgi:endonuclease/exonuclease/phosphatase (EEP) superfamily protein YafD
VYKAACNQPTNQIGITAWHQQRLLLDKQNRHQEHPREAFTNDLISSIQHHQSLHHHVIVGGDFNDTLFTNRSQLLRLANATQLTVPWWTALYPQFENFNTYQRGVSRIDSVLMSHELVETIKDIGYSPFNWFTTSDHRALLIDFDTTRLFCDQTNMLHPASLRGLRSNDKNQVATFINHCHDH